MWFLSGTQLERDLLIDLCPLCCPSLTVTEPVGVQQLCMSGKNQFLQWLLSTVIWANNLLPLSTSPQTIASTCFISDFFWVFLTRGFVTDHWSSYWPELIEGFWLDYHHTSFIASYCSDKPTPYLSLSLISWSYQTDVYVPRLTFKRQQMRSKINK